MSYIFGQQGVYVLFPDKLKIFKILNIREESQIMLCGQ